MESYQNTELVYLQNFIKRQELILESREGQNLSEFTNMVVSQHMRVTIALTEPKALQSNLIGCGFRFKSGDGAIDQLLDDTVLSLFTEREEHSAKHCLKIPHVTREIVIEEVRRLNRAYQEYVVEKTYGGDVSNWPKIWKEGR